jgi:hypothetical protein
MFLRTGNDEVSDTTDGEKSAEAGNNIKMISAKDYGDKTTTYKFSYFNLLLLRSGLWYCGQ